MIPTAPITINPPPSSRWSSCRPQTSWCGPSGRGWGSHAGRRWRHSQVVLSTAARTGWPADPSVLCEGRSQQCPSQPAFPPHLSCFEREAPLMLLILRKRLLIVVPAWWHNNQDWDSSIVLLQICGVSWFYQTSGSGLSGKFFQIADEVNILTLDSLSSHNWQHKNLSLINYWWKSSNKNACLYILRRHSSKYNSVASGSKNNMRPAWLCFYLCFCAKGLCEKCTALMWTSFSCRLAYWHFSDLCC